MDAWKVVVISFGVICTLIGVIYGLLRSEDKRLAKNIHELRNDVQSLAIKLATLLGRRQ